MPKQLKAHKFKEEVEDYINKIIYDFEYLPSKNSKLIDDNTFEQVVDLLEFKHTERDYEWMSEIMDSELFAIINTDASGWASQYFQSRDFVEVKLEGNSEKDEKKCIAAKKCLNSTLNNRGIYHYHKYIRARLINNIRSQIYALCWWEKKKKPVVTGFNEEYIGEGTEESPVEIQRTPIYEDNVTLDRFNYEPIDPRNIFTDNKYCYSIQDKDYIIIRSEVSYEELKSQEEDKGYFNLHLIKESVKSKTQTDTARETYEKDVNRGYHDKKVITLYDKLMRFGKLWCMVKTRDGDGYPVEVVPGYDKSGEVLNDAELVECIIEQVIVGSIRVLIRFQPNPYKDSLGNTYRPVIRGLCYIHPTKDTGLGDGKLLKENQITINDGLNMAADRAKLATLPTLIGKRSSMEDNSSLYFAPEHIMQVENPREDLKELKISDNITGIMSIVQVAKDSGQKATAVYPTTMGSVPYQASTTATAVAGAEQRTNLRSNYKSLTFEYTYLLDFYWTILQMTYQFAEDKTAFQMMGKDAQWFDPDQDYSYSPVSSNIELEYNKYRKIQNYDQHIGRLVGLVQSVPQVIPIIAHMIRRTLELQGDEYVTVAKMIENFSGATPQQEGGENPTPQQIPNMNTVETSNQYGYPTSPTQEGLRLLGGGMR